MRETVRPVPEPAPPPPERAERPAKTGYPLPATLIVCALLILGLIGGSGRDADVTPGAESIGFVVGWTISGLILWGIAWLITIRHASKAWKWSSFGIVVALGLLTGLARLA
ncbi:MAG: hypothetical protein AAGE05_10085 [Pseudomonadota bacterium]